MLFKPFNNLRGRPSHPLLYWVWKEAIHGPSWELLKQGSSPLAAASTNGHLSTTSDRIARNRKTIVCPMIDVIDHDDFRYETQAGDAMRGAFDWEMYYKRIPIPPELQKADPSEPFE